MILTEKAAKECWCPFARTAYSTLEEREFRGVNRLQGPNEVSCIASECMAWQWLDPDGWSGTPEDQRRGYCGLSGKPEA